MYVYTLVNFDCVSITLYVHFAISRCTFAVVYFIGAFRVQTKHRGPHKTLLPQPGEQCTTAQTRERCCLF